MLHTIQAYRLAGLTRRGIYVVGEAAPDLSLPGQLPAYHLTFPGEMEAGALGDSDTPQGTFL